MSEAVLVKPGKNKYLVLNAATNTYDEYPIKIADTPVGKFLNILVAPPVLGAGFLTYQKKVYKVSLHDLLRNHVNVTNPTTISTITPTISSGTQSPINTDSCRPEECIRDEVDQAADILFQEQSLALYEAFD